MKKNKRFFILSMPIILAFCSLFTLSEYADAAARTSTRGSTASARRNVTATTKIQQPTTTQIVKEESEPVVETQIETQIEEKIEPIISNKSNQFDAAISEIMTTANEDNSFAEQIRKQRAALAASEASTMAANAQKNATATNSSSCDIALRKCMSQTCGSDFTKCALDGDTIFGDKLNKCKKDSSCTGEEFSLFATEIKADRDMNVRLSSYNNVVNCGNSYNACIMNECGTTYSKCLGKKYADAAIQKCATIARECTEADSGLTSRFGTAIGKLRETAETDVKQDEERMYKLRDLMKETCEGLGATFDERTFDCVYTVNFFAGENQRTPLASRKRYAGDSFVCMQEWFGVNTTTAQENAYRETRSQTAASAAMLGSGLGTAAGLVASGAIDRALDTQKAKKEYKEECEKTIGKKWKNGKCVDKTEEEIAKEQEKQCKKDGNEWVNGECLSSDNNSSNVENNSDASGNSSSSNPQGEGASTKCNAEIKHVLTTTRDKDGKCKVLSCKPGYQHDESRTKCEPTEKFKSNCSDSGGTWNQGTEECDCPTGKTTNINGKCVDNKDTKKTNKLKSNCEASDSGGTWNEATGKCDCPKGKKTNINGKCVDDKDTKKTNKLKSNCEASDSGGKWNEATGKCDCPTGKTTNINGKCVDNKDTKKTEELESNCYASAGDWDSEMGQCICPIGETTDKNGKCVEDKNYKKDMAKNDKALCEMDSTRKWDGHKCVKKTDKEICKETDGKEWKNGKCVDKKNGKTNKRTETNKDEGICDKATEESEIARINASIAKMEVGKDLIICIKFSRENNQNVLAAVDNWRKACTRAKKPANATALEATDRDAYVGIRCQIKTCADGYVPVENNTKCKKQQSKGTDSNVPTIEKTPKLTEADDPKEFFATNPGIADDTRNSSQKNNKQKNPKPAKSLEGSSQESSKSLKSHTQQTTKVEALTPQECEKELDEQFRNGVPAEYVDDYNNTLNRLKNKHIEGFHNGDRCEINPVVSSGQIVCMAPSPNQPVNTTLQNCDNASTVIPSLAKIFTRERLKNRDCGEKKGRLTDILVNCQ